MKWRVLGKAMPFHPLLKKKGPKRCRFEQHYESSSSPGRARQGKKKISFPCFSLPSFSEKTQKNADQDPHLPKTLTCGLPRGGKTEGTCPMGGPGAAAQWPPRPPYPCTMTRQG